MSQARTVSVEFMEIELVCEVDYSPFVSASGEDPSEPALIDILEVRHEGEDIYELMGKEKLAKLADKLIQALEE